MEDKKKLLFDVIFDIYKIFLGAGLTLLVAVFIKSVFGEVDTSVGLKVFSIVFIGLLLTTFYFGFVLLCLYKDIED